MKQGKLEWTDWLFGLLAFVTLPLAVLACGFMVLSERGRNVIAAWWHEEVPR